jgi:pSer/pThr/pTyr-binding forkhead associated (FHA) protein
VLQMLGADVFLEDLNSTNGTYVNGKAIKKQLLHNGDTIEVGKYQIKFVNEGALEKTEKPMGASAKTLPGEPAAQSVGQAAVKVMSGPSTGRQVPLLKVVTTIGKPGIAVAAITRRSSGYVVALVEGAIKPTVNGNPIGTEAINLRHGDLIELAGTQMQFVLQ